MKKQFDIIIIGASASGLAAAINAKKLAPGKSIALLERLPRVGKKILATGNGRCNLSNIGAVQHPYRNKDFVSVALSKYGVDETLAFFKDIGLLTYTDSSGRIYPMSNTASGVLDSLRFATENCGIEIFCDTKVCKVKPLKDGFIINDEYSCKKLLIATGGCASPAQGSDGSGYALLKSLGHRITQLYPSLVQLTSPDKRMRSLKGVRVHDAIIEIDGTQSRGEVLFTDYGLSGIATMEISAVAARKCENKRTVPATLDLLPTMTENEISDFISSFLTKSENMLNGLLPKAVGTAVLREAGVDLSVSSDKIRKNELYNIARIIKHFEVVINGTKGFDSAQVTSGGADVREFDAETLKSKIVPSLWCSGEILDIDGGCGGFNLQWAWSSGLLAGEKMAKELIDENL